MRQRSGQPPSERRPVDTSWDERPFAHSTGMTAPALESRGAGSIPGSPARIPGVASRHWPATKSGRTPTVARGRHSWAVFRPSSPLARFGSAGMPGRHARQSSPVDRDHRLHWIRYSCRAIGAKVCPPLGLTPATDSQGAGIAEREPPQTVGAESAGPPMPLQRPPPVSLRGKSTSSRFSRENQPCRGFRSEINLVAVFGGAAHGAGFSSPSRSKRLT
jgi:hypothetical protein